MSNGPFAVFVYGTLMRGEERAAKWPRPALRVEPAVIRAALYDLGPYPAVTVGEDLVRGELWRLAETDMTATLAALDAIECYGQGGVDLYVRRLVSCSTESGETCTAHCYFIADPRTLADGRKVSPGVEGWSRWRRRRD
ncbi:MAG: gamma-glutamylcyclotransferase family protein [Pirellulaceae bacterium]